MRWVNRLLLFKVHDMLHNFLNKAFRGARFTVVHVCTKSAYDVHKRSCTRTSSSFSPDYSTREQLARGRFFEGLQNYMQNKNEGNENKIMLGDLNCTMDKIERDGENKKQRLSNYALSKLIVNNGIEDIWRRESPDSPEFTYYDRSFAKDPG